MIPESTDRNKESCDFDRPLLENRPKATEGNFHEFRRLSNELLSHRRGTDMGLYFFRRLAEKIGERLSASGSGLGVGAEFTATLKGLARG